MVQTNQRDLLDDNATAIGIFIGLIIGTIYALFHIQNRGATTRKNIAQFGAGSLEMDIESSISDAKRTAQKRLHDKD